VPGPPSETRDDEDTASFAGQDIKTLPDTSSAGMPENTETRAGSVSDDDVQPQMNTETRAGSVSDEDVQPQMIEPQACAEGAGRSSRDDPDQPAERAHVCQEDKDAEKNSVGEGHDEDDSRGKAYMPAEMAEQAGTSSRHARREEHIAYDESVAGQTQADHTDQEEAGLSLSDLKGAETAHFLDLHHEIDTGNKETGPGPIDTVTGVAGQYTLNPKHTLAYIIHERARDVDPQDGDDHIGNAMQADTQDDRAISFPQINHNGTEFECSWDDRRDQGPEQQAWAMGAEHGSNVFSQATVSAYFPDLGHEVEDGGNEAADEGHGDSEMLRRCALADTSEHTDMTSRSEGEEQDEATAKQFSQQRDRDDRAVSGQEADYESDGAEGHVQDGQTGVCRGQDDAMVEEKTSNAADSSKGGHLKLMPQKCVRLPVERLHGWNTISRVSTSDKLELLLR
jgi:hypothetical protein